MSRRFPLLLILTALALTIGSSLVVPPRPAQAEEDADIILKVQSSVEIEEVLRSASVAIGTPLIWNPTDKAIRGKKLTGGIDIKAPRQQFFGQLRAILAFYELVIIPVGPRGYELLVVVDARRTTTILKLKAKYIELNDANLDSYATADGLYVTTTIPVKHLRELRSVRNALTRIVSGQNIGNVTEVQGAGAIVVTDFAPNVVACYRLIKEMDRPAETVTGTVFRTVPLQHATATEVSVVLTRLFHPLQPGKAGPRVASSGPSIQADARTNQILVNGTPAEVETVLTAIKSIDGVAQTSEVHAHILMLSHMPAREAAQVLQQTIGTSRLLWRDAMDGRAAPGVTAVHRINALIISASNAAFERIRPLVAQLDEASREDAERKARAKRAAEDAAAGK